MGLDVLIRKMMKVENRKWTDREIYDKYPDCELLTVVPVDKFPDFQIEGSDGYLFKCVCEVYDKDRMMAMLGIKKEDGWREYGSSSSPMLTPEEKCPPEDTVDCWFSFVNEHGSGKYDDWEFKEIPVMLGDDSLIGHEEFWCILVDGADIADMRKGANEKFYGDGLWDDSWRPVCSKRILKEHMEKYFDDGPGYLYENCREAFKTIIYDKFEDGMGLCVTYS